VTLEVDIGRRLGSFALDARFASAGRVTALFGPSGAGKTSLVNCLAGLIRPGRGRIVVDGRVLFDHEAGISVPPHKRRIGYVFQEGRLFPHLTVRQNLLYGRWFTPRAGRRAGVEPVVELLGIQPLLDRRPGRLSGGEKQRVALGRALLADPSLLLMDEPLASLDAARKEEILPYIERLRDETRIPIVYVSHSVAEVARLASTMVVLSEGRVQASGPVGAVMSRLDLVGLIGREEAGAVLETIVERVDAESGLTTLRTVAGALFVPRLDLSPATPVRVRIRARDVMIATQAPSDLSALNVLQGRVAEIAEGDGAAVEIRLDCGGEALMARLTRHSVSRLGLKPGHPVYAVVKAVAIDGPVDKPGAGSRDTSTADAAEARP
jgi:molybdate transport system ATP-binding protein